MKNNDWKRQDWDALDTKERSRDRKIKEHVNDRRGHKAYGKA